MRMTVRPGAGCVERVAVNNTFMGVLVSGPATLVTRAAVTRALPRFSDVSAKQSREGIMKARPTTCAVCETPLAQRSMGRPRKFCRDACRWKAGYVRRL